MGANSSRFLLQPSKGCFPHGLQECCYAGTANKKRVNISYLSECRKRYESECIFQVIIQVWIKFCLLQRFLVLQLWSFVLWFECVSWCDLPAVLDNIPADVRHFNKADPCILDGWLLRVDWAFVGSLIARHSPGFILTHSTLALKLPRIESASE